MKFQVDAWDPGFGTSAEGMDRGGPAEASTAKLDVEIECGAADWRPLDPDGSLTRPEQVLLIDGVRRTDARIWIGDQPGLACSYAAGAVSCSAAGARIQGVQVKRTIFTSAEEVSDVDMSLSHGSRVRYDTESIIGADETDLANGVQRALIDLEIAVSRQRRTPDDLLIVDGPLRGRDALPRALGYIKTQQKQYLPEGLIGVVSTLRPAQRTPVFRIAGVYERLTWYLKLPMGRGGGGSPWAGIARVECSAELPEYQAVELAAISQVTIPRFASVSYKDPRAPQNLVPIAGLERRLRQLLGDSKLLHRALIHAAGS